MVSGSNLFQRLATQLVRKMHKVVLLKGKLPIEQSILAHESCRQQGGVCSISIQKRVIKLKKKKKQVLLNWPIIECRPCPTACRPHGQICFAL